jgi:hypothetical protein
MRTRLLLTTLIASITILSINANADDKKTTKGLSDTLIIKYSGSEKAIVNSKCFQCHSMEARFPKSRNKLNFDSLSLYTKVNQLSKLDKISEVLEKGSMPPEKFLEKFPEGKLNADELKILKDWAKNTSDLIMK